MDADKKLLRPVKPNGPLALCKYVGGKRSLLKHLLPLIPKHKLYVEVFCGAAALFFNKPRAAVNVLNDINLDLVNAFRVARHHNDALVEEMFLRLNSRYELAADNGNTQTDLQRAADFLINREISFGADGDSFGVQRKQGGGGTTSLRRVREKIEVIGELLDGVAIENLEWRRCLALYDCDHGFFFCDPPYIETEQRTYSPWKEQEFAELVDALRGLKAAWMLTINDCREARAHLRGLRVASVSRQRGIQNQAGKKMAELIVRPK